MAEIFNKTSPGPSEKVLILAVREQVIQPFQAPDWTDLRVGFLLSLCDDTADDTITGLGPETITIGTENEPDKRYWIGVKDRSDQLPSSNAATFIGFSNSAVTGVRDRGDSKLVSSDLGIGTTNTDYWRPLNDQAQTVYLGGIFDGGARRGGFRPGAEQHFVQNFSGGHAAGYATLLMLRIRRDQPTSKVVTVTTKTNVAHTGDVLFTSDPSKDLLLANMESFPTSVQTVGPVQLREVPSALFAYWPFFGSRLRIHCWGILRLA